VSKQYLFISDIHLGLQSKEIEAEKEKLLVKFLEFAESNCDELFIVGDLFDYWFEYKRVYQKGYFRTLSALKNLTDKGIMVHYFIGNHDFLHRDFFEKEIGAIMYRDAVKFSLNEKKFFIGHGDGMVENDAGYKILKWVLRNKITHWLYSLLHPDFGIWLASRTSKSSREYTANKDYGEVDGLFETAKKKIDQGSDYVIFGHLHKKVFKNYNNGCYINLGSWLDEPCYGIFNKEGFKIINWV
jgi:UDP-2,3-diacylglucosamine hydrolase